MPVHRQLPWKTIIKTLPADIHRLEAVNEWVLWRDPDEWTEE
jgi:hypothetical protein